MSTYRRYCYRKHNISKVVVLIVYAANSFVSFNDFGFWKEQNFLFLMKINKFQSAIVHVIRTRPGTHKDKDIGHGNFNEDITFKA